MGGTTPANSLSFFPAKACVSCYWLVAHWTHELLCGLLQSHSNPFWFVLVMSLQSLLFIGQFSSLPFFLFHATNFFEKLGHLSYKMSHTSASANCLKVSLPCSPDSCISWKLIERFMLGLVGIMFKFLGKNTSHMVLGTAHYLTIMRHITAGCHSFNNVKTIPGFRCQPDPSILFPHCPPILWLLLRSIFSLGVAKRQFSHSSTPVATN